MTRPIPWLRVFVEGVVIVGSILLAFGIDAWWDDVEGRARVGVSLSNVAAEVTVNQVEIRWAIGVNERRRQALVAFLDRTPEEVRLLPTDSLRAIVDQINRPAGYDPGGGALA